ncbi:hypothetical protein GCM10020331_042550 [Ectobacillus funiculus]
MKIVEYSSVMFIGFAGGIAVGGGFVAFLAVLGIIPRLVQLTKSVHYVQAYEWAVITGALIGSWFSLRDTVLSVSHFFGLYRSVCYAVCSSVCCRRL